MVDKEETEAEILKRYEERLKGKVELEETLPTDTEFSKEYEIFKEEVISKSATLYERLCNSVEKIIQIRPPANKVEELKKSIEVAHLNITPTGAASFAMFSAMTVIIVAIFSGAFYYLLTKNFMVFTPLILIMLAGISLKPLTNIPNYIANRWRLKATNQMVICILYVVMYMRHTSNLELAIKFAAQHIKPPLSLDLRKIFWDVETEKYSTIKESLDSYLETWRHWNQEFITSFHLIESSLYEPSEERRLQLLDKALEVILEGTYEKMLHYAQNLKNPITMLHMLGIILPILGLVIFPLVASFLQGAVKWYHLFILYDVILPLVVLTMGLNLLSKRPTGYGETEISKLVFKEKKYYGLAIFLGAIIFILGLFPLIIHLVEPATDFEIPNLGKFLDYRCDGKCGPYGLGALIFSLFLPLAFAISIGLYYKIKVKNLIKIRNETVELEKEFASSLFQLGNRIGDGIPAELAFGIVAKSMEGTPTGNFFRLVSVNIQNLGMSLKEAIFNPKTGAILSYPSSLIESSMEVLIESSKKGSKVVAQALTSISNYVNRIHQVNERLKDLLTDIISSMKSQINFLTPIIAGIVVGISSMIVTIIGSLGLMFQQAAGGAVVAGTETMGAVPAEGAEIGGGIAGIATFFNIKDVIPSYYFQIVVGLYVVELIVILTILANGIENGPDKLNQDYLIGKNMFSGFLLYLIVALAVILMFNLLARTILSATFAT